MLFSFKGRGESLGAVSFSVCDFSISVTAAPASPYCSVPPVGSGRTVVYPNGITFSANQGLAARALCFVLCIISSPPFPSASACRTPRRTLRGILRPWRWPACWHSFLNAGPFGARTLSQELGLPTLTTALLLKLPAACILPLFLLLLLHFNTQQGQVATRRLTCFLRIPESRRRATSLKTCVMLSDASRRLATPSNTVSQRGKRDTAPSVGPTPGPAGPAARGARCCCPARRRQPPDL